MLFQVVHCHPLADSYNHALFRAIVDTLEQRGHAVVASDLYREGFEAAMSADERRSYFAPAYDDRAVAALTALLRRVDGVIFCFPQWWFAMPALLKGYVDRVWAPGIAFAHGPRGGLSPLLTHLKVFGVVTSYGSPWWVARLVAGDPGRKVMMRALKPMCGRGVRSFYLAQYDMDRATARSRQVFIERVRERMARL